jgi:hypothetical protein
MIVLKQKDNIFFTTRKVKGMYSFMLEAMKRHAEDDLKKKLNYLEYSYNSKFSLKLIYHLLRTIFKTNFLENHKFSKYKLYNCELGRHVVANSYTSYNSHFNNFFFFYSKIKNLIVSINILLDIRVYEKNIKAIYIDHGLFLNGIIINYFSNKNKIIYSNNYPRGIFFKPKKYNVQLSYENFLKIRYNSKLKLKLKDKNLITKKLKQSVKNPTNFYPWMRQKMFKKFKKNKIKDAKYLIYCHAFTDAQLQFGYDELVTLEEWLKFTLHHLSKNNSKIIVKSHPNFNKYNKYFRSKLEVEIFEKIKKEYADNKNIIFMSDPIKNFELLKELENKKTILITHHGTSIIEGAFLNFKFISFEKNFWSKEFELTNTWKNKKEYKELLNKNINKLKYPNNNDLFKLCYNIYLNDARYAGKNYYVNKISKTFNVNKEKIINRTIELQNFNKNNSNHVKLVDDLKNNMDSII